MASEPHPRPRRIKCLRNEENSVSGPFELSYGSWLVVKDGPWLFFDALRGLSGQQPLTPNLQTYSGGEIASGFRISASTPVSARSLRLQYREMRMCWCYPAQRVRLSLPLNNDSSAPLAGVHCKQLRLSHPLGKAGATDHIRKTSSSRAERHKRAASGLRHTSEMSMETARGRLALRHGDVKGRGSGLPTPLARQQLEYSRVGGRVPMLSEGAVRRTPGGALMRSR
jgi:hypothetical protein